VTARNHKREASAFVSIYDGRTCVGHVHNRGRAGFELFNADDRSLGLFPTQRAAIDALEEVRP
jgi:hypothetical protein